MSYAEQLKKPQWQKKRLEILERDKWTCQMCGDTEATLTVHHKSYKMVDGKFVDIWDYDNCDLTTLCELCHSKEELELKGVKNCSYFELREACENAETMKYATALFEVMKRINKRRVNISDINDLACRLIHD